MASLDDIWDVPVTPSSPKTPRHLDADDYNDDDSQRPSKRQKKQALFLSDSEDEGDAGLKRGVVKAPPPTSFMDDDIEALFADAEGDEQLSFKRVEALDVDAMEREAEARHRRTMPLTPHPVIPSSSPTRDVGINGANDNQNAGSNKKGEDSKKRRRPPTLNENLLLGPTGFPDLIDELKYFKVKGKGRETEDLTRLLRIYHFWTHKLYPRTKFRDTVVRIEKLCHTKRMQVALSVWRDEAHGKTREQDVDLGLDSDSDREQNTGGSSNNITRLSGGHTSGRPATPRSASSGPDIDLDGLEHASSSRASSQPPVSDFDFPTSEHLPRNSTTLVSKPSNTRTSVVIDDEEDFWKELEDASAQRLQSHQPGAQTGSLSQTVDDLDDEEMWAALEEVAKPTLTAPNTGGTQAVTALPLVDQMDLDDDDMWDIVRHNEKTMPPPPANPLAGSTPKQISVSDQSLADSEMGWDDMYAD